MHFLSVQKIGKVLIPQSSVSTTLTAVPRNIMLRWLIYLAVIAINFSLSAADTWCDNKLKPASGDHTLPLALAAEGNCELTEQVKVENGDTLSIAGVETSESTNLARIFTQHQHRLFWVKSGVLLLSWVRVSGGKVQITNGTHPQLPVGRLNSGGLVFVGIDGSSGNDNSPALMNATAGVIFEDGQAFAGGGIAAYGQKSVVWIQDSQVARNHVILAGGGIHLGEGSSCTLVRSELKDNVAGANWLGNQQAKVGGLGGGVCVQTSSTLSAIDSFITNNVAVGCGEGENEKSNGGGIYALTSFNESAILISLSNTEVNKNNCTGMGGGVYLKKSLLTSVHSTISSNSAGDSGGGVHLTDKPSSFTAKDTVLAWNRANANGGGIACYPGSTINAIGSQIVSNSVSGYGGGVFSLDILLLHLTSTLLEANQASNGGGVFSSESSAVHISGSTFRRNQAKGDTNAQGGGLGLYNIKPKGSLLLHDTAFEFNSATAEGAELNNVGYDTGVSKVFDAFEVYGGGMSLNEIACKNITATSLSFVSNSADGDGGGASFKNVGSKSAPMILSSWTMERNVAMRHGGALILRGTVGSMVKLTDGTSLVGNVARSSSLNAGAWRAQWYKKSSMIGANAMSPPGNDFKPDKFNDTYRNTRVADHDDIVRSIDFSGQEAFLKHWGQANSFAVHFSGTLRVRYKGTYLFKLIGGANTKMLIKRKGSGPSLCSTNIQSGSETWCTALLEPNIDYEISVTSLNNKDDNAHYLLTWTTCPHKKYNPVDQQYIYQLDSAGSGRTAVCIPGNSSAGIETEIRELLPSRFHGVSTFDYSEAKGGALYVDGDEDGGSSVIVEGPAMFENNTADGGNGGAILLQVSVGSNLYANEQGQTVSIIGNVARQRIHQRSGGDLTMGEGNGGGLFAEGAQIGNVATPLAAIFRRNVPSGIHSSRSSMFLSIPVEQFADPIVVPDGDFPFPVPQCQVGHFFPQNEDDPWDRLKRYYGDLKVTGDLVCQKCPAGYATKDERSSVCNMCLPGEYQDTDGREYCSDCPGGWLQEGFGNTSCVKAKKGTIVRGGATSIEVPQGFFLSDCKDENNEQACTYFEVCPAGWIGQEIPTSLCEECDSGRISVKGSLECTECLMGMFADAKHEKCSSCPAGKWSDQKEMQAVDDGCRNCTVGKYSSAKGVTTIDDCNLCTVGKYSSTSGNDHSCKSCPSGWFQDIEGKSLCRLPDEKAIVGVGGASQQVVAEGWVKVCDKKGQCSSTEPCKKGTISTEKRDNCTDCPSGWTTGGSGANSCTKCDKGKYAPFDGSDDCYKCDAERNEYTDKEGASTCKICETGKYSVGSVECIKIETSDTLPKPTQPLVAVSSSNWTEMRVVWKMNANVGTDASTIIQRYNVRISSDQEFNNQMEFSTVGIETSAVFPAMTDLRRAVTFVQIQTVGIDYKKKVVNSQWSATSSAWLTTGGGDCIDATQFLNATSTNPFSWQCAPCPRGGSCDGPKIGNDIIAKFGWARCSSDSSSFAKCSYAAACLGGPNPFLEVKFKDLKDNENVEQCNTAYANNSRLCGRCDQNFSHVGLIGKCDACPDPGQNIAIAVVGVLGGIIFLFIYIRITLADGGSLDESDGAKSIGMSFIQLISLLVTFPIAWPPIFVVIFQVGGAITVIGQHLVNLKCMFPEYTDAQVFFTVQTFWGLAPPLLLILCWLTWHMVDKIMPCFSVSDLSTKIQSSCVAIIYLLWPSLCSQTFSMFACRAVCDNDKTFLRADLEVVCGEGEHLMYSLMLGVPMLLVYVLGLPVFGFLRIKKLRSNKIFYNTSGEYRFDPSKILQEHKVWGLFYSAFREETWWWEATVAGRKVVIAMIGVFGTEMEQMQVHLTLMLVVLILSVTAQVRPFGGLDSGLLHKLEMASLIATFLTLWAGSVFNTLPRCEDPLAGEGMTLPWCSALSVVVGVSDIAVFIACVTVFVHLKLHSHKEQAKQHAMRKTKTNVDMENANENPMYEEKITDATKKKKTQKKKKKKQNQAAATEIEIPVVGGGDVENAYENPMNSTKEKKKKKKKKKQAAAVTEIEIPVVGGGEEVRIPAWCEYTAESGKIYYHNRTTNETSWTKPAGV